MQRKGMEELIIYMEDTDTNLDLIFASFFV